MSGLLERFRAHAATAELFPEPGLALLAVSGGPDSVALLDLCIAARDELALDVVVGHVDHGIHPASADVARDVAALAERFGVPCRIRTLQLGPSATETLARRERYRVLGEMRRDLGARYLVTAHHADDEVETVLYRLLRGSGVAGLAGIPATARGGLVRPLLPFTRRELEAWVRARALPAHLDPANVDPRHDRSWLRARLLPEIRDRFADVDRRILETAADASRHRRAWSALLDELPGLVLARGAGAIEVARGPLRRYHKALSEALLRTAAREVGCRLGRRRCERLLRFSLEGQSGQAVPLGEGWCAEIVFDRIRLRRTRGAEAPPSPAVVTGEEGALQFGAWEFRWRHELAGTVQRAGDVTWVRAEPLGIRAWVAGDRFTPLGGVGRRKVRRLLMEARVPLAERRGYPLLVTGDEVLWAPGVCRSNAAVPVPGERSLRIEARPPGAGRGNPPREGGY